MARFSRRKQYTTIKIHDKDFYVQFIFVEATKTTKCYIYDDNKVCIAKSSVTHKEPDECTCIRGEQEAFKVALDKYMDKVERDIVTYTKNKYNELVYIEKQLTYKLFKMTPLELEKATK